MSDGGLMYPDDARVREGLSPIGERVPELFVPRPRSDRSKAVMAQARDWYFQRRQPADPNPFPKFHLFRRRSR